MTDQEKERILKEYAEEVYQRVIERIMIKVERGVENRDKALRNLTEMVEQVKKKLEL